MHFDITLATKYRLPAIYFNRLHVAAGGLMSYGPDLVDQYRRAANLATPIASFGARSPASCPSRPRSSFRLVINLKTAKALGLTVPDKLLAIADEVIE
jgi:putative ABC transport system substrate-binding protein